MILTQSALFLEGGRTSASSFPSLSPERHIDTETANIFGAVRMFLTMKSMNPA
jgi:hypothetical protein